ncbi:MAG: translation initiation factor IF-2 [Gemmatimonadota bacterium]
MQVIELAEDLKVETDALIALLRQMGIPVADEQATITDGQKAKVLAKVERERRAGRKDPAEAIRAAVEETASSSGRRRRRRRRGSDEVQESEEAESESEDESSEVEAAAEAPEPEEEAESDEDEAVEAEAEAPEADDEEDVEAEADDELEAEEEEEDEEEEDDEEEDEDAEEDDAVAESEDEEPEAEDDVPSEEKSEGEGERSRPAPASARAGAPDAPVRSIRRPTPAPAASAGPGGQVRIQAEGYTPDGRRKRKDKKKGKRRQGVDQDAVQSNIQRVMAEIKGGSGGGKKRRRKGQRPSAEEQEEQEEQQREEKERERTTVRVNEFLTVAELSELVDATSTEIIGSAFKNLGLMVTINQRLDFDQIELLLDEFGYTAVLEEDYSSETVIEEEEEDPESLKPRSPVVTVMGHVDHGKTLLLDSIRKTNVVAGEAGGITQHIGAYHVELPDGRSITFLDTPGHAAFTAMRARGADVTDIVILLVAADDSVMPQTIEAISHAKNAGVPMIVAINKCDLPAADPGRVKQELLQHSVNVEDFGGDVLAAEISAKTGKGIDDLLEKVLLQAEILELKANPDRAAQGTVVEAQLDVGKGPVVSVLIQKGTLRVGDSFVCGLWDGRVRAMLDERGKTIQSAGPATPVQVLGASGVPQAGDTFQAMDADQAGDIAGNRQRLDREKQLRIRERGIKLGDFGALVAAGETSRLPLVIKGDVDGSVQALSDALEQLGGKEVQVDIIHRGVGAINESDVLLAETAGAVIIGFRVRPQTAARQAAERNDIDIHVYDVIYEAVDEVTAALEGMLAPEKKEAVQGTAEVREVFKVSKVGTIAGCYVTEGRIDRKGRARVVREGIVVYDGEIHSLKRFKDDVKEVREGFECGIGIANFNDVKVGDLIECYTVTEVARTLANVT